VEKVNLEPFATVTINMVNSLDYGLERNRSILTKPYLNPDNKPGLQRLIDTDNELYRILQGIVAYSIKLVSLSTSNRTPKQKVEAFADFIEKLDKPALAYHIEKGNIQEKDFIAVLMDIRSQEELLDAMKAAQPLIDFMLQYVDSVTDRIRHLEIEAENEIERDIDNDYAIEISYVKMLHARRDFAMKALILVNEQYMGRGNALVELNRGRLLSQTGIKPRHVTTSNVKQLEQELIKNLSEIEHQLGLMDKDSNNYLKVHQELDELVKFHDQEIRKAKGVIQLWSSAHTKMANGMTDPADWFDLTDPGSELFGLVKSAIIR